MVVLGSGDSLLPEARFAASRVHRWKAMVEKNPGSTVSHGYLDYLGVIKEAANVAGD